MERRLVLEAMGRSANLLLLDGEGRIIDCIRRVDGDLGRGQRQLLPGLFYRQPWRPTKLNPFTAIEPEELRLVLENPLGKEWDKLLLDSFTRACRLWWRRSWPSALKRRPGAAGGGLEKLKNNVNENGLTPYLLVREGKPVDFTVLPILQYGPETESKPCASFSQMLDGVLRAPGGGRPGAPAGAGPGQGGDQRRDRTACKLANQTRELEATRDRERLRELGDILTSTSRHGRGWRLRRWTSTARRAGRWRSAGPLLAPPAERGASTIRTTTRPRRRNRCSPSNWKRGRGSWST